VDARQCRERGSCQADAGKDVKRHEGGVRPQSRAEAKEERRGPEPRIRAVESCRRWSGDGGRGKQQYGRQHEVDADSLAHEQNLECGADPERKPDHSPCRVRRQWRDQWASWMVDGPGSPAGQRGRAGREPTRGRTRRIGAVIHARTSTCS
jgi:hypothetical protein